MRERFNFNQGFYFMHKKAQDKSNVSDYLLEMDGFERVTLPHSLRLEPFYNNMVTTYQGIGIYCKYFPLAKDIEKKMLFLEFEGVMGVTDVWLNGVHLETALSAETPKHVGEQPSTNYGGYLPFIVCLNDAAIFGETDNVLIVITNNYDDGEVPPGKPQPLLDFTYFGGIYRNVWLCITEPIYITDSLCENIVGGGGVFVSYENVSQYSATLNIRTHIRNTCSDKANFQLSTQIIDSEQHIIENVISDISLNGNDAECYDCKIEIKNPKLWNIDTPYLYQICSSLFINEIQTDSVITRIGIRTIAVDRARGILINGEVAPLLSGVNRHQDYPFIGNAAPSSMQRHDAVLFKSAGFNVVRAAHYPMSADFLDACDELGILLFEATPGWQWYPVDKPEPFTSIMHNNIRQMVRRDRNHPCILAYEIVLNETYHVPFGYTRKSALTALSEQPSAKIATESYGYNEHPEASGIDKEADFMFGGSEPLKKSEKALMFCREYADGWEEAFGKFKSRRVTRGITGGFYPGGEARNLQQANNMLWKGVCDQFCLAEHYKHKEINTAFAGGTIWTGIDSRGMRSEMSPCGIWDGFRLPKFSYFAYASQRNIKHIPYFESLGVETGPLLFIASNWTKKCPILDKSKYDEDEKSIGTDELRTIYVYSNVAKVTLCVMKSGEVFWEKTLFPLKAKSTTNFVEYLPHPPFEFLEVPYILGSTLKAQGFDDNGIFIIEHSVTTAGIPYKVKLTVESRPLIADGFDKIFVYARILDKNDNLCTDASNSIYFNIKGCASIVGDNNRLAATNPFLVEAGIASTLLQSTNVAGEILVTARCDGLECESLKLSTQNPIIKSFPYSLISTPQKAGISSDNLVDKPFTATGEINNNILEKSEGIFYPNSIGMISANCSVTYRLQGEYCRLFVEIPVSNSVYKIILDGVLYFEVIPKTHTKISLELANAHTIELATTEKNSLWLSPYLLEGSFEACQDELHQNLAANMNATASVNAEIAANVLNGKGQWVGEHMSNGVVQWWQLDLDEVMDIRNAKVFIGGNMGSDSTNYSYDIHTSTDGVVWTKQSTNKRTSWANGILDKFVAKNVRYIRVTFVAIEGSMIPQIGGFEVYPDFGVNFVEEYNLKGFYIEGFDIVFDSAKTEYTVKAKQPVVTVRALPTDCNATIQINKIKVIQEHAYNIMNATPVSVSGTQGSKLVITVVSVSGLGKKEYIINFV